MSRYLMTICCALFCLTCIAQGSQREINEIKKSKHYVYAMAASANSKEEATESAKALLMLEVEQWLKEEKKDDVAGYVAKVKNNTAQIETQRGKLYRVFVYVAKKDILPYYNDEEIETVKSGNVNKLTVKTEPQTIPAATVEKIEQPNVTQVTLTATEKQMLTIDKFADINAYISENKANGKIGDCGKYTTMPKDADVYMFVYNKQGEVCAKIKKTGAELLNMNTLQRDDIANYKGCGAIWIKMKE